MTSLEIFFLMTVAFIYLAILIHYRPERETAADRILQRQDYTWYMVGYDPEAKAIEAANKTQTKKENPDA